MFNRVNQSLRSAHSRLDKLNEELSLVREKKLSYEMSDQANQYKLQLAQSKLEELNSDVMDFQQQVNDWRQKVDEYASQVKENIAKIEAINSDSERIDHAVNRLNDEIAALNNTINRQPPRELWGNYCINGHLNCKELPNKVYRLGNAAEIEAFRAQVEAARRQRTPLEQQLNELKRQRSSLELQQKKAKSVRDHMRVILNQARSSLDFNQQRLISAKQAYQNQFQEIEALETASLSTKDDIYICQNQIAQFEAKISANHYEIARLELDLEQEPPSTEKRTEESPDDRMARLREVAAQEIAEETAAAVSLGDVLTTAGDIWPSAVGGLLTNTIFHRVEQEFPSFFGKEPTRTGDLFVDYAVKK